jgi:hypothetical protein
MTEVRVTKDDILVMYTLFLSNEYEADAIEYENWPVEDDYERFKIILQEFGRDHHGDCTGEPYTCLKCVAEEFLLQAKRINRAIELPKR